jgi:3-phytase
MVKRTTGWILTLMVFCAVAGDVEVRGRDPLTIAPVLVTDPLYSYDHAPATPDADDPAIWVNRGNPRQSLLIGTAKDVGLLVYDMSGRLR